MQFDEEQQRTLDMAVATWGEYDQECMAVGECGEFIALQGRKVQGRATPEDWVSEIADVMITMEQMAKIHGYDTVKAMVKYKMERLRKKLEDQGVEFQNIT